MIETVQLMVDRQMAVRVRDGEPFRDTDFKLYVADVTPDEALDGKVVITLDAEVWKRFNRALATSEDEVALRGALRLQLGG